MARPTDTEDRRGYHRQTGHPLRRRQRRVVSGRNQDGCQVTDRALFIIVSGRRWFRQSTLREPQTHYPRCDGLRATRVNTMRLMPRGEQHHPDGEKQRQEKTRAPRC